MQKIFFSLVLMTALFISVLTSCKDDKDGNEEVPDDNANIEMIFVQGGTFLMGDPESDWEYYPTRQVTLSDFYIGKHPVTQSQWKAIMGSNPSKSLTEKIPVIVNWDDLQAFINKINDISGLNYRLPTEAEWEYAARGGAISKGFKYSGSNNIDEVAWYGMINGFGGIRAVCLKLPNELGIYDMSGNIEEWCSDFFGRYPAESQTNPTGPVSGVNRVARGGCYSFPPFECRVLQRSVYAPYNHHGIVGFRLVLPCEN